MNEFLFLISNYKVTILNEQKVIKGLSLKVRAGEIHAIMGPNGSGKTTLALSLMGHPSYKLKVRNAKFKIDGQNMFSRTPEQRARAGLFITFQSPIEISGVSFLAFLRTAHKAMYPDKKIPLSQFKELVKKSFACVGLDEEYIKRNVNEGFSGGERKRAEIAQLLVLKPKVAVLDEIDSGLDVDSLKTVAKVVEKTVKDFSTSIILITHYQRILHHLKPSKVHILRDGMFVASGGMKLVNKIEKDGYATI